MDKINRSVLEDLLKTMLKIRNFELAVEKNFQLGHIYGTAHLAIGQEATAAGSIAAIKENDLITSTHRGHGHCIAKGADLKSYDGRNIWPRQPATAREKAVQCT